jgi:hypothetical protein
MVHLKRLDKTGETERALGSAEAIIEFLALGRKSGISIRVLRKQAKKWVSENCE